MVAEPCINSKNCTRLLKVLCIICRCLHTSIVASCH